MPKGHKVLENSAGQAAFLENSAGRDLSSDPLYCFFKFLSVILKFSSRIVWTELEENTGKLDMLNILTNPSTQKKIDYQQKSILEYLVRRVIQFWNIYFCYFKTIKVTTCLLLAY